jgi:hypothetical protein
MVDQPLPLLYIQSLIVKASSTSRECNISTGRGKRRPQTHADMIAQRENITCMANIAHETL